MALLTAEDVLNKAFSKTKYREGFDQDEVDDFLDEVANTIAALTAERDELSARVASGAGAPEAAPLTSAGGVPGTTGLLAAATDPNPPSPAGMLAMAQKLHDEYVYAGEAERDRIVDEAKGKAEQIVERAEADAKERMDELAGQRVDLEGKIDDLRRFERDYRLRLKAYLENLLGDLDHGQGQDRAPASAFADEPSITPEADAGSADGFEEWSGPGEHAEPEHSDESTDASESADTPEGEAAPAPEGVSEWDGAAESEAAPEPEAPAEPVSYDPAQPWEAQLDQDADADSESEAASPVFSPVTGDEAPEVAPAESDEAPYTPPSARMFTDLYRQPHKDEDN